MPKRVNLTPPPESAGQWAKQVYERVGEQGFLIQGIALASLPSAGGNDMESSVSGNSFTRLYYVPDSNQGGSLVFSNGTDWIDTITGLAVA